MSNFTRQRTSLEWRIAPTEALRVTGGTDGLGVPDDIRLGPPADPYVVHDSPDYSSSLPAWRERAAGLRRQVRASAGLLPERDRSPLNPTILSVEEHDDFSVARVYFESLPGLHVTGNLFRPADGGGVRAAILNPHGHWRNGRLQHDDVASPPARCVSFARQGYVAFLYDMVGYLDSPGPHEGLGGPLHELWGVSLMGLQLWNSVRAVDFLTQLPDVDPERLGCTGASGGATQTLLLTAADERIRASAPVVMVSAHMQGDCLCENGPNLRIDTDNIELAALMAPRPMLLVGASGDWTKNTAEVEYPALRAAYRLFDAEDRLECFVQHSGHNYNRTSREAVYAFFARWLREGEEVVDLSERPMIIQPEGWRVFPQGTPSEVLPSDEVAVSLVHRTRERVEHSWPQTAASLADFRAAYRPVLESALAASWPVRPSICDLDPGTLGGTAVERLVLGRPSQGDQIPAWLFVPDAWSGQDAVLAVHEAGKEALIDEGRPAGLIQGLLDRGVAVLAPDVFLVGEFQAPSGITGRDQRARFFSNYNRTDTAWRVQDVLTSLCYLRERAKGSVLMAGIGAGGLWTLLARGLTPNPPPLVADVCGIDTANDREYLERCFVPLLRAAGDLRTALFLAAPAPALIHNTQEVFTAPGLRELYEAMGGSLDLRASKAEPGQLVDWLARHVGSGQEER